MKINVMLTDGASLPRHIREGDAGLDLTSKETVESAVTCIKSWLGELDPESWGGPLYCWPLDALWWRW